MKRFIASFLALAAVLAFAACKKKPEKKPPESLFDDTTSSHAPVSAPTYNVKKYTDDVIFGGKDYGDVTLLYPELDGSDGANALIFDAVKRRCTEALPNLSSYESGDMPEVTYEITSFRITYLSETFLSAKVEGVLTVSLAPHPSPFVYALNFDLENLIELGASDILSDFDRIKKLFTEGKFTLEEGDRSLLSDTSAEDIIMQYRSEYEIYPQIWFSSEKLYLNAELVYTLGSNAVYSIDLGEVKAYLNAENKEISKIIK